jgi:uridylate kinase
LGVQVAIVIGGGNIFRGHQSERRRFRPRDGDHMGMLATVINALAIQDALEKMDVYTRVLSAIEMRQVARCTFARRAYGISKKSRCDFRSGHRQSLFLHRHDGRAARHGDQSGSHSKGDESRGIYDADPVKVRRENVHEISYMDVLTQDSA